ncbi:DUF805 domain-containing protein [Kosakonia sp. CCTCC M2018092]|uniref:DUF805 domain-containing protein n=1 Tax=Kosakonia sp. CCTCC M2018092 TaxID=2492396 RepID=UPI000F60F5B1|nr:DUF805 domain-containing protein [Kosakonia sp. CCTCC M2018092]AZI89521.1 DUF805 domain-containing protein [Kosakonia sp. CCTCC M2018092]
MGIQQWLFSFKGRIGRRDFWIWMVLWVVSMTLLFVLANNGMLDFQTAAFILVCLIWPTACVMVKRLHDRGRHGGWALLMVLAWMLLSGNWAILDGTLAWAVGRLIPVAIIVVMMIDLGAMLGTQGKNRFGNETLEVKFR